MAELMAVMLCVSANDRRVVGVVDRMHVDHRVVVDPVVEPLAAHQEGGDDLARMERLGGAGDDPRLDQVEQAIGEHLRMDSEVALVIHGRQGSVGDAADAQLQRGAVLDQISDVLADASLGWTDRRSSVRDERMVRRHGAVDLVHMDKTVAQRSRHARIDLRDDRFALTPTAAFATSTDVPSEQ